MLARNTLHLREFQGVGSAQEVVILDQGEDHIPFDRIVCGDLRTLGQAWLEMNRKEGCALPCWSEFRPYEFKPLVEKLCVMKVEDWRNDKLEFSVFGGHATDFIGCGRPFVLQEMRRDPRYYANYCDIRDRTGRAIDSEAPQYVRKTLSWNDRNFIEYEVLMLPFRPQNGVQRLLQPISARARSRSDILGLEHEWCEVARRRRA